MHKLLILLMFAILQFAAAQNSQKPCSAPEARQFDFWIGEWELTWPGGQGGTPEGQTGRGVNHVVQYLGECVIFENFSFADSSFIGKSWSVYNLQKQLWQQTWVDNSGGYLLFTGGFADGKMELRTAPFQRNGVTYVSRMVFRNIAANAFDWDWQRSADNGETWQDVWNIHYQRKTESAGK
ncbi:MAG: DUF1579 family protein [Calditrichaeota bacterium]|nr:DUF1579 family protein [Calditrichota bacterium]